MTEDKHRYRLLKDNILFFSVPLCAVLGMIKFDSSYKILGLCSFVCVFCVIYKLYTKITNYKNEKTDRNLVNELLSTSGFMVTIGVGIFAEFPVFRWLFLIGIILSAIFSDILSALISTFAYVLIITVFTGVTPEFIANSFFTAIILIVLTQYYSDFISAVYSVVTVLSFEVAFYIIMHGLRTDSLITASHIVEAGIISLCILLGWILFRRFGKNDNESEVFESIEKAVVKDGKEDAEVAFVDVKNDSIDVKDVILDKIKSTENKISEGTTNEHDEVIKDKDYSYLLNNNLELYNRIASNGIVFNEAKRTSKFVKEITELIEGNASLAEAGAFLR